MTTVDERERVGQLVAHELKGRLHLADIHLDREHIRLDDDWWYVPVWPEGDIGATYQYYQGLAEIETDLQDKHAINVILLPAQPPAEEKN
jgi:hypothetical protein